MDENRLPILAIQPRFDGEDAWIIGGGPSVKRLDLLPIHGKNVIGVNNSFMLGDWVDVCWFGDCCWFNWYHEKLASFNGTIITKCKQNSNMKKWADDHGKDFFCVHENTKKPLGLSTDPEYVCWNKNSGSSAINIASLMGAKRIFLLGFDMCNDDEGETHWHGGHFEARKEAMKMARNVRHVKKKRTRYEFFLLSFPTIEREARRLGIEIINANPNSKISAFKKMSFEEALCY